MRFGAPEYLHILWLLVPLAAFLWWSERERRKALERVVEAKLLPALLEGVYLKARRWKGGFFLAAMGLMALALARPQWGFSWEELKQKGNDVFIAIDTSKSMLAEDVKPNRLARAKREVRDLLQLLKGDRIGLIAFAGTSFVLSPLTLDAAAVRLFLDDISVDLLPQGGTAIAQAIEKAAASFPGKEKKHKILILLTDGEDLQGGAVAAAKKAEAEGVRIYTVGVGTPEGAPIPAVDSTGTRSFIKDKNGQTVLSKLDLTTLSQLSPAPPSASLAQVYEKYILPMEKKELETRRQKKYEERFQWPLFLALVLLFFAWLLPERKEERGGLLKRLKKKKGGVRAAAAGMLILLFPGAAWAITASGAVSKGNEHYQEEKWEEAASRYSQAQAKKPASAEVIYNLANALYKQGQFKKARQLYEKAVQLDRQQLLAGNLQYNIGNTHFRLGKYPEALQNYERALEINPEDEDTRYNYELVKKLLEQMKQQKQQQQEQQRQQQRTQEEKQEDQKERKTGAQEQEEKEKEEKESPQQGEKQEQEEQQTPQEGGAAPQPQQAQELTEEEAEALLNAIKDEELNARELRIRQEKGRAVTPEKDW